MDLFNGPVWASHNNCRSLAPHNRQYSDEQIKVLVEKEAVIGVGLDAWTMVPNWQKGISTPESKNVTLETMFQHIDHICQIAGNADHVGIGTDLDGGYGIERSPADINTIADVQKMVPILEKHQYSEENINKILSQNFIDFLFRVWQ